MRWPLRRKSKKSARPADTRPVDALTRPVNPNPAWRHSHPLPTLPRDPRITHPVEFSQSVAGSQSLTTRLGGTREAAPPDAVGLVHLQARLAAAPATELIDVIDLTRPESELPLRLKARRLPSVPTPLPTVDFVHAPAPTDEDGDDGFGFGWDGPESEPQPPEPEPAPEVVSPERMRVFRPRKLGFGDPLPHGARGSEPGRTDSPTIDDEPDAQPVETDVPRSSAPAADDVPRRPAAPPTRAADEQFHAAVDAAIRDAEVARTWQEPVPPDLSTTLSSALGRDVGARPIHRGPNVTERARALGARAFTRHAEVYVSDDVGPLAQTEARATIAHELTHVAQQEALGVSLPDEGTAAGRRLEHAARSVEAFVRGTPGAPRPTPELLHPDRVPHAPDVVAPADYAQLVGDELVRRGLAYRDGAGDLVVSAPATTTVESGVQRQPVATEASTYTATTVEAAAPAGSAEPQILEQWNLNDELRRNAGIDEQVGIEEQRKLTELNEDVARENEERLAHNEPLLPAITALTDEQRTAIRTQVTDHFDRENTTRAFEARTASPQTAFAPGTGVSPAATTGAGAATPAEAATSPGGAALVAGSAPANGQTTAGATAPRTAEGPAHPYAGFATAAAVAAAETVHTFHHPPASTGTPAAAGAPESAPAGAGTEAPAAAATPASGGAAGESEEQDHKMADLDDIDVEELVLRVYPRLRTALRNELLTDRERAGMLTDFR